ncbi:60S ribosomal protein L23 [Trifolium medium]|uniref:60S ribosomal protein L23 n=1 Tax=Trifolium medium TaxID=97028 RepID=A0A392MZQ7_9FABA|nr:60S ribosomal protein L23 [Trifolium medium]
MEGEDKVVWKHDNKGVYTVKSAYLFAINTLIDSEHYKDVYRRGIAFKAKEYSVPIYARTVNQHMKMIGTYLNEKIWEEKTHPVRVEIHMARDMLCQWRNVRQQEDIAQNRDSNNNIQWQPPMIGEVKCNVGAAFFNEQHKLGIGMCIRNDRGMFVRARTKWLHGCPPPVEAEAWALKEAITWMGELEISRVVI